jgi:hypothetical protein
VLTAGDQIPLKGVEFAELLGKTGAVAFWHTFATGENVGVIGVSIVMVSVVFVAHIPADGANVYVVGPVVAVLTGGDQVPVIASNEVVNNEGVVAF